ncbi:hypothetical protein EXU48_20305 [Occultella glacieicola]|uniref:Uncharacterized protein n=1 Tax=Occultella glacieicola TaxID=2518684 RepID=A0ABY2DYE4_9MICO|nr:hypothetical protein [Occultella glacieicola]TDE89510.1 hypothetical protein EXU48_20305 [Occultella glacieicola]
MGVHQVLSRSSSRSTVDRERGRAGAPHRDERVTQRALADAASLGHADVHTLQRTAGNRAVAALLRTPVQRVGGPPQAVGGRNVITFNGTDYQFEKMSIGRLSRLLDAITGTPDEHRQIGIVSEARRQLRRRIETKGLPKPPPVDPTGTKAQRQDRRHSEYAAMRELKFQWSTFVGVQLARGVASRPSLVAAYRKADQALQDAVRAKRCLEKRVEIETLFANIRDTYRAERIAASTVKTALNPRTVTIETALINIRDHLGTSGLQNKTALKKEVDALNQTFSGLRFKVVRILDLRDGFDHLTADVIDLAERAANLKLAGKPTGASGLSRYYGAHDGHNQVITNASPLILVPLSNSAAIAKGTNVITAVQHGDQLAVAAKTHANSVTIIGTGDKQQFHIRLSQGTTQIRLETIVTTQSVPHPDDASAPKKKLHLIDFKQIQFGH